MSQLITTFFQADHARLDALFDAYVRTLESQPELSRDFLRTFADGLRQHIRWEEDALFPLFEQKTGMTGGPTMVMRHEHEQILQLLDTLLENADDSNSRQQLMDILAEHNAKEENILYPMTDQHSDNDDKARLLLAISHNGSAA